MKKIALVYDLDEWILGSIARELVAHLSGKIPFELQPVSDPSDASRFRVLQGEFDALHFLSPWIFLKYRSQLKINSIVTIHHVGSDLHRRLPIIYRKATRLCSTNLQCVRVMEESSKRYPHPVVLTPYGLDAEFFRHVHGGRELLLSKLPGCGPAHLLIGLAAKPTSNEDHRKGFDRYWELLRKLKDNHDVPPFRLVVFGPGPEHPQGWRLEQIPEDIRPFVLIIGFTERAELPALYSGLDFYLCLSRLEGGPYPVLECMACETPVISTAVGSVIGLVEDEVSGWIVNESNFLDRIPGLLRSTPSPVLRAAARSAVVGKHSFSQSYSPGIYSDLYRSTLAEEKPTLLQRVKRWMA